MSHRQYQHAVCVLGFGFDDWLFMGFIFLLFIPPFLYTPLLPPVHASLHLKDATKAYQDGKTCLVELLFLTFLISSALAGDRHGGLRKPWGWM
jgi:hypothetical protein